MDHIDQKILSIIDAHADELNALAEDLYLHAEQGYHEYRHVLPARMMALLAYRLLKDGGREARQVIADYRAPHTPETYRAYVQSFPD